MSEAECLVALYAVKILQKLLPKILFTALQSTGTVHCCILSTTYGNFAMLALYSISCLIMYQFQSKALVHEYSPSRCILAQSAMLV